MLSLIAGLAMVQNPSRYIDSDNDGLLDYWETEGFGPIDPKVHGCSPRRPDVFIVFRIRSTMTQAKIQPTIDRVKKFFADLPYTNPDGSKGLNMIPIVPPPMPKETDGKGYNQLYEQAMPVEWRGLAHGILVDDHPGGGGQANRPDWCGTGYNWPTMVHELGHQFGLPHDPRGARTGSPFHSSLMNYDYSYQLGGDANAIRYSDGRFAKLRMKETALNETLPFPAAELEFLSKRPYYFKVKALGEFVTAVDWNRNGIYGESGVRADINDGYSAALRGNVRLERSAGAPAMTAFGNGLLVVYPELEEAEKTKGFDSHCLTQEKTGRIRAQLIVKGKAEKPVTLVEKGVTGDISVAAFKGKLFVAYPGIEGTVIRGFSKDLKQTEMSSQTASQPTVPTLVVAPNRLLAVIWTADQKLRVSGASLGEQLPLEGVESTQPVGAAWNTNKNCLAVATVEKQGEKSGRIRIHHARQEGKAWKVFESMWVEGEKGNAATSNRPQLIYDAGRDRGPEGAYNVYVKGNYKEPNQAGLNYVCRQIADPDLGGGWRVKMMGNEWAFSRSVCAVAQFNGDIAYAYRWSGGDEDGRVLVSLRASGVEDEYVTDFDEVGFIFKHGLKDSLRSVQREQWVRKKG